MRSTHPSVVHLGAVFDVHDRRSVHACAASTQLELIYLADFRKRRRRTDFTVAKPAKGELLVVHVSVPVVRTRVCG